MLRLLQALEDQIIVTVLSTRYVTFFHFCFYYRSVQHLHIQNSKLLANLLRVVIKKMRKNLQSWESLSHNAMLGYFLNTLFVEIIPGTSRIVAPFIPGTSRTVIPSILISSCQMNIPWCRHPWFWFMQGIAIKNVLQI